MQKSKKSSLLALEPPFFENIQNGQNGRDLHVSSFPEPYYTWKVGQLMSELSEKKHKKKLYSKAL